MTTTYTTNLRLGIPALGDRSWNSVLDTDRAILDAQTALGALAVTTTETPSTTLNIRVTAGNYRKADGTIGTYAGTTSLALPTATTTYLWLTDAGVLTTGTGFPTTAHVRLASVVAGATTITSVTDQRVQCSALGTGLGFILKAGDTLPAGANFALDTVTGTKIGTATTQKLAVYGVTPVVQASNTSDLRTALINFGIVASGGATPLNLNGGALVAGPATYTAETVALATKTAAYTIGAGDCVILANAAGGAFTVTLPSPTAGRKLLVKKIDSSANVVTVSGTSVTIDGAASVSLSTQWQTTRLVSDGTNWFTI